MLKSNSIVEELLPLFWLGSVGKRIICAPYLEGAAVEAVASEAEGTSGRFAITDVDWKTTRGRGLNYSCGQRLVMEQIAVKDKSKLLNALGKNHSWGWLGIIKL